MCLLWEDMMGWFSTRIGRIVLLALGAIALLTVGLLAAGCGGEEGQKASKKGQKAAQEGQKAALAGTVGLVGRASGFEDDDGNLVVDPPKRIDEYGLEQLHPDGVEWHCHCLPRRRTRSPRAGPSRASRTPRLRHATPASPGVPSRTKTARR